MKKILHLILVTFAVSASFGQVYQPVTYNYNGTPANGVKIKTNLPFLPGSHMPTIIIEGYNYATSDAIGLMVSYYIYSPNGTTADPPSSYYFLHSNVASYGSYTPVIKLAGENNKIVIFIDSKDYFQRFSVRIFSKGLSEQASWFEGWTVVDEALTGLGQITVPYKNRFRNEVIADGKIGIGTSVSSASLGMTRPLSSGNNIGIHNAGIVKKGVSSVTYYNSSAGTDTDTVNVNTLFHYSANQSALGANSSIAYQYGFYVGNSLTGAANNYAFYSNMPKGTGKWGLYLGAADNYIGGRLGIGTTSLPDRVMQIALPVTGSTTAFGILNNSPVQSDVTAAAFLNYSQLNTQAASFNLGIATHFAATQGTIGVGSTITTQNGFWASNLTGASKNFGFRGSMASSASNWNLYMDGTANNYLGGNLGIGITTPTAKLEVRSSSSGSVAQTNPLISARGPGNSFEFGHPNLAGYASTLGANSYDGKPFLCFNCEAGTDNNTYRTRGKTGTIITADMDGGLRFGRIADNNADNQLATTDFIMKGGQMGIGTMSVPAEYKLAVAGNVIAEKIKIKKQSNGWPDYVFSPDYRLTSLEEIERFTKENQHLPEIPSAREIEKEGQDIGEMNRLLLKKIEELTLYVIEQNKKIQTLEKKNQHLDMLQNEIQQLKNTLKK